MIRLRGAGLAVLATLGVMVAPGPARAQLAGEPGLTLSAFPKFSPMPVYESADLKNGQRREMRFGKPLSVVFRTPSAVRVLDGDKMFWVRRSHVAMPPVTRFVRGGKGFKSEERPKIRFWRSLSILTEFLARAEVSETGADLEEILTERPRFTVRYPVIGTDVVEVLGKREIRLAAVMVPVRNSVNRTFDEVRGGSSKTFDIHFVADASGDAVRFTNETLSRVSLDLQRQLSDSANTFNLYLSTFGSGRRPARTGPAKATWASLRSRLNALNAPSNAAEPLLTVLHDVVPKLPRGRTGVVVVLSGAELEERSWVPALTRHVSIGAPELSAPKGASIILAEVTPEPGRGLKRLAASKFGGAAVSYKAFSGTLGQSITSSVLSIVRPRNDRPLTRKELARICAPAKASEMICVLPTQPSTGSRVPQAPFRTEGAGWFSVVLWLVIDGLVVEMEEPG